nr:Retrotransposon gag protein [Ipomoea batatas]
MAALPEPNPRLMKDFASEDALTFIWDFYGIVQNFSLNDLTEEELRMRCFAYTLKDAAKAWFMSLMLGSLRTWTDVYNKFTVANQIWSPSSLAVAYHQEQSTRCRLPPRTDISSSPTTKNRASPSLAVAYHQERSPRRRLPPRMKPCNPDLLDQGGDEIKLQISDLLSPSVRRALVQTSDFKSGLNSLSSLLRSFSASVVLGKEKQEIKFQISYPLLGF